jgi:hypothetical protein
MPALTYLIIQNEGQVRHNDKRLRTGIVFSNALLKLLGRSPQLRTFKAAYLDSLGGWEHACFPRMENFTRLEIALQWLPSFSDFYSFLANNPRLETLVVKFGGADGSSGDDTSTKAPLLDPISVSLAHLQTFALVRPSSVAWCQQVLQIIDAPNTVSFRLDLGSWPLKADCDTIMRLLCSDKCTLISPSLRNLSLGPFRCGSELFVDLFTICPNLTRLDWVVEQNRTYSMMLSHSPWVLPRLSWIRVSGVTTDVPLDCMLEQTVGGRRDAGLPLRVLEVNAGDWEKVGAETKDALRSMMLNVGSFESDPEPEPAGEISDQDLSN